MADRYTISVKTASLTRSNTTATKLFDLPEFARLVGVRVFTAATATGATFTMGDADTANKYVNANSVATAGMNYMRLLNITALSGGPKPIYGSIGGTPVAGGPFTIIAEYISDKSTRVL